MEGYSHPAAQKQRPLKARSGALGKALGSSWKAEKLLLPEICCFLSKEGEGKNTFFFFSNPVPLSNRSYLETAGQMRKIIYKGQSPSETAQSREQIGKQTDKQMANRSNHLGVQALTMDFCFPIH